MLRLADPYITPINVVDLGDANPGVDRARSCSSPITVALTYTSNVDDDSRRSTVIYHNLFCTILI